MSHLCRSSVSGALPDQRLRQKTVQRSPHPFRLDGWRVSALVELRPLTNPETCLLGHTLLFPLAITCHPGLLPLYPMSESYTKDDPRLRKWLNIPGSLSNTGKRLITDVLVSTIAERGVSLTVEQRSQGRRVQCQDTQIL